MGLIKATVQELIKVTPSVYLLRFTPSFEFKAGQFVTIMAKTDQKKSARSYSIASLPSQKDYVELIIKRVEEGFVSNYLGDRVPGDDLQVIGPAGTFEVMEPKQNVVFVATGTGIGPFVPMVQDVLERNTETKVTLIFGTRYEDQVLYEKQFRELENNNPNFKFIVTVSRPKYEDYAGEKGYVQECIKKYFQDLSNTQVYICGLDAMIQGVITTCKEMGLSEEDIHYEKYD